MREIVVVLDNIRSALNVGAILRTCDGAAVNKVYLCGVTPNITHVKISKTALGAEFNVPVEYFETTSKAIANLKALGFTVAAIELTATATMLQDTELPEKLALVFGHEATGVQLDTLKETDMHIMLPMLGSKNSLNVATTAGIVVYYIRLNELKK